MRVVDGARGRRQRAMPQAVSIEVVAFCRTVSMIRPQVMAKAGVEGAG